MSLPLNQDNADRIGASTDFVDSDSSTYRWPYHSRACDLSGCARLCDVVDLAQHTTLIPSTAPADLNTALATLVAHLMCSLRDVVLATQRGERQFMEKLASFARFATVDNNVLPPDRSQRHHYRGCRDRLVIARTHISVAYLSGTS